MNISLIHDGALRLENEGFFDAWRWYIHGYGFSIRLGTNLIMIRLTEKGSKK